MWYFVGSQIVSMGAELLEMLVCIMGFLLHWYVYKPCDKYQCRQGKLQEAGGTSAGVDYHFCISCWLGENLASTCWEEWIVRIGRN